MNTRLCVTAALMLIGLHAQAADPSNPPPTVKEGPCPSYIETGVWFYRDNEWTLSLTPSTCGRQIGEDEIAHMFYEVAQKFSGSRFWENDRGLINQLRCHLNNARDKPEWNLEPWRPAVSYAKTADAKCNVFDPDPDPPFE